MLKIYLDSCCVNRPFDAQTQNRIYLETEAIKQILARFERGDWQWIASTVLVEELNQTPNVKKRSLAKSLLVDVHHTVPKGVREAARGKHLEALGFSEYDALHLACAETGQADLFLTTDDSLLKKARSVGPQLRVPVENPLTWLKKVPKNERSQTDR